MIIIFSLQKPKTNRERRLKFDFFSILQFIFQAISQARTKARVLYVEVCKLIPGKNTYLFV